MEKRKDNKPIRALTINIKNKGKYKEFYEYIDNQCWLAKNLYNKGMYDIRQLFIATKKVNKGEEINEQLQEYIDNFEKWLNDFNKNKKPDKILEPKNMLGGKYIQNEILRKYVEEGIDYINLRPITKMSNGENKIRGGQIPRQIIRDVLCNDWDNYFKSVVSYNKNPSNFTGRPQMPRYKNKTHGRAMFIIDNLAFKIIDGYVLFNKSTGMSHFDKLIKTNLGNFFDVKNKMCEFNEIDAKCIKFIPKNGYYQMQICYSVEVKPIEKEMNRVISIDMGVNRLATVCNNIGEIPFCINGKPLKAINQQWNKERSRLQSILMTVNDKKYSKRIETLTNNRNNKIKHYIHLSSTYIVRWCVKNNIDTLIIGKNDGWKQNLKKDDKLKSDKVRQNFVNIPFNMLIGQLKYKCENEGIKFIEHEESYSSGTSFLDNEEVNKEFYNKDRRVTRGMFISNDGRKIHADLNGAYQIGRKVNKDLFKDSNNYLHPIVITMNNKIFSSL